LAEYEAEHGTEHVIDDDLDKEEEKVGWKLLLQNINLFSTICKHRFILHWVLFLFIFVEIPTSDVKVINTEFKS
jgi:hypothetical protein